MPSFRFSVDIGLMCGSLLLFHDSFIIFHVKNNAVQHAYYYHNTFAPHCFCGLAGREMVCAVMGVSRRFLVCLGVSWVVVHFAGFCTAGFAAG